MAKGFSEKVAALAAAGVGIYLLSVSIRLGAGVGGDATIYITSARNLLAGNGLGLINPAGEFRLIPYFPPFYPLVLAFFGLLGFDIPSIAGILNVVFYGLTIAAVSLWISTISKSALEGFVGGLLVACSPVLVPAYSWAMSEPLCILLGITGLIALERFLETGGRGSLIVSGILCGLSFLTRYSAAAYIGIAGILLLFFQKKAFIKRLRESVLFGLISVAPMGFWLIYDLRKTATVASRSMLEGWNLLTELSRFNRQMKTILLQWLIPDSWIDRPVYPALVNEVLYILVILFILGSLVAGIYRFFRKNILPEPEPVNRLNRMTLILSGFCVIYTLVILLVSVTTYPPITIGSRMFTPAHVSFLWLIAIAFVRIRMYLKNRPVFKILCLFVLLSFTGFYGLRSIRIARQNAIDGLGYNSVRWQESEVVDYLQNQVSESQLLVTNEETALLFLMNRASWPVHEVYVNKPDAVFYAYGKDPVASTDYGRAAFQKGEALLVVFDSFEDQMRDIYGENTQKRIDALFENLKVVFDGDDGTIYSLD